MGSSSKAEAGTSIQSLLFVPGSRLELVPKALAGKADAVCIDLEDSVAAQDKATAREGAIRLLEEHGSSRPGLLALRINALTTREGLADLLSVAAMESPPLLLLPMVESRAVVVLAGSVVGPKAAGLVPLIETSAGLGAAAEIAAAPRVTMMMFGGGDLSSELGVALGWEPLLVARGLFLLACAGAKVPAIDVPFIRIDDSEGLEEETRLAKRLGFSVKAAIHPSQIDVIHRVMRPTPLEIEEARAAEEAFAAAGGAATRFRGKLLEAPLMERYRRVLSQGGIGNA